MGPKAAQGTIKSPKRSPKASQGTPKIHQKSTWDPTLVFKGARQAPGVSPGRKMTLKSMKSHKKGQHPALCFNIVGAALGGTVPKKQQAFRAASYTFFVLNGPPHVNSCRKKTLAGALHFQSPVGSRHKRPRRPAMARLRSSVPSQKARTT